MVLMVVNGGVLVTGLWWVIVGVVGCHVGGLGILPRLV